VSVILGQSLLPFANRFRNVPADIHGPIWLDFYLLDKIIIRPTGCELHFVASKKSRPLIPLDISIYQTLRITRFHNRLILLLYIIFYILTSRIERLSLNSSSKVARYFQAFSKQESDRFYPPCPIKRAKSKGRRKLRFRRDS
jgi:hypothetical protein